MLLLPPRIESLDLTTAASPRAPSARVPYRWAGSLSTLPVGDEIRNRTGDVESCQDCLGWRREDTGACRQTRNQEPPYFAHRLFRSHFVTEKSVVSRRPLTLRSRSRRRLLNGHIAGGDRDWERQAWHCRTAVGGCARGWSQLGREPDGTAGRQVCRDPAHQRCGRKRRRARFRAARAHE